MFLYKERERGIINQTKKQTKNKENKPYKHTQTNVKIIKS